MTTNPYQVLGPSIPSMLGRAEQMRKFENHLLKPMPDHVSVVGPAHYGKSVLLKHLAGAYAQGAGGYLTAAYVDLRHGTPTSDHDFMGRFAEEIKAALQLVRPPLAELIDLQDEIMHEVLGLVFEDLEKDGTRLLVVLDGFDYVLAGTGLSRDLWDQLRVLAQRTSLRLVSGSRRPLRELCRTEESRTSDFWEIFYDTPLRITALGEADVAAFLRPLRDAGCELDDSARKEIANWTGGAPLLLCALLQRLWAEHRAAGVSKPQIDRVAEKLLAERRQLLDALWDDCDRELQADLGVLSDRGIPLSDLSDSRRGALEERGFGRVSGNRMRSSCRLMQRYAQAQAPAIADLSRLLGTAAGFATHARSLLELRLAQVSVDIADEDLRAFVKNAIRDLAPVPERALVWIRSIANRALKLVWEAELPPDRALPAEWREEWDGIGVNYPVDQGKLPRSPGAQCNILRLVTGTERTSRQARYVTKTTCLLIDPLHSVGDFGQHRDDFADTKVSLGFAFAAVLSAISLAECLTADLHQC